MKIQEIISDYVHLLTLAHFLMRNVKKAKSRVSLCKLLYISLLIQKVKLVI